MIDHKKTGYLSQPFETEDLAGGIAWILSDHKRSLQLNEAARRKAVHDYAMEIQAQRYLDLYNEIVRK